jgi:hypothetical protein
MQIRTNECVPRTKLFVLFSLDFPKDRLLNEAPVFYYSNEAWNTHSHASAFVLNIQMAKAWYIWNDSSKFNAHKVGIIFGPARRTENVHTRGLVSISRCLMDARDSTKEHSCRIESDQYQTLNNEKIMLPGRSSDERGRKNEQTKDVYQSECKYYMRDWTNQRGKSELEKCHLHIMHQDASPSDCDQRCRCISTQMLIISTVSISFAPFCYVYWTEFTMQLKEKVHACRWRLWLLSALRGNSHFD